MRVVIVGATGNIGTSLLRALAGEERVQSILGVARRRPAMRFPKTEWAQADVASSDLVPLFRGADAVVHLAWLIQPSRDLKKLSLTNVEGSSRIFDAVRRAEVPALVYGSSVGAYARGPKDRFVDESWPIGGTPTSFYGSHKAEVERRLDAVEERAPELRIVRMRPAFVFKREAASEVRRVFTGPFLPSPLVSPGRVPFIPNVPGLRFQAVHSFDAGEAYRLAITRDVRGPFNIAAEPVLDPPELARALKARLVPVPARAFRSLIGATWRLRLQPTQAGWLDLGLDVPLLDTRRAREELGWTPRFTAVEAFLDLCSGIRDRAGIETPPLSPRAGGPMRVEELATGVGETERL